LIRTNPGQITKKQKKKQAARDDKKSMAA